MKGGISEYLARERATNATDALADKEVVQWIKFLPYNHEGLSSGL